MRDSQPRKASEFQALHAGEAFVIPNPWDAGSARLCSPKLGFHALATTSSGFAFTLGRHDGEVTLDEVIEHTAAIDAATDLPVSVDLENGYGADPESAATAITRAAEAGAVGGSIEDWDPVRAPLRTRPRDRADRRGCRPPRGTCRFRSCSPRARRTTSAAIPISTTRSNACRRSSTPAPTSCTRPGSAPPARSGRCATPFRSR